MRSREENEFGIACAVSSATKAAFLKMENIN